MKLSIFGLLLTAMAALLLGGCASDKAEDPNHVSTIPWNRPESWEGKGPLGGMAPGSR